MAGRDDDDLELLRESYAEPDDNYVHLLGFRIPKLWRVLWGSGEEDKKIRWETGMRNSKKHLFHSDSG